jgi:hypothetical protein
MRFPLVAVALLLTRVPAVYGDAVGLRDDLYAAQIALAGPDVMIAREFPDGRVQVYAVPRTGGAPRTLVSVALGSARVTMRPGDTPQTLPGTAGLARPAFAGAAIAAIDEDNTDSHPVVVAGDGSRRVVGGPTGYVTDIAADGEGVAWLANGAYATRP